MILTLFESVQKAYTRKSQIIDTDWESIAQFLTTHQEAKFKEDVPLFNLWQFDPNGEPGRRRIYENNYPTENYETVEGTIRRCKANAKFCHGLILDYDGETRIGEAIERLADFEIVLYTTYRHSEDVNKFRIVLPFKEAASPAKIKSKKASLCETFTDVDQASFSESQSFYLHSGPNPVTYRHHGHFLDLDWFEDEVIEPVPEYKRPTEFTGDRSVYKEMLIDSLATCSGLHYNGVSKYNVLTLVALCKSADFTYDEFNLICVNMAASDSSLHNDNLRRSAWLGWKPHSGITAKVREEFITAHGGVSKFGQKQEEPKIEFRSTKEIALYVREKYGIGKME